MSLVEMGPVTSGVLNLVKTGSVAPKRRPLYVRDGPKRQLSESASSQPIKTLPMNDHEKTELNDLRSLREAIRASDA
jgi:hypothetical protein